MIESWRILLFLFFFIDSFPLFFCQRFYDVSLQNSPQEIITINNGLKFVQEQQKNITSRKELLCSTFMNGKNPLSQRMLYVNLRRLHTVCDFAIVLYAGNPDEVPVCKRNSSSVIHCARAEITLKGPAPKKVYPKPFLYMELKPYLSNYRRVFLIDEDVSLFKFNYTIYSAIWNCGFYPSPPPLITQALVSEGTQWFNFVHFDKWRQGRKNVIWAVESVFIEQQAPLIDSIFLHWLLEYVIPPTLPLSMETGSDWGTDIIWCYAAYTYARQILHITDPNYVPCSILTKAPPIVHRDGKTIAFKKENFQRFNNEGFRMVALYRTLYPSWICNYTENAYNPLNEENKHLRKGYKLKKECYPHQLRIL